MQMFDLTTERPLSLPDAAELLPRKRSGKKVSVRTITRWMMHGHHGVLLEGGRFGDTLCTSAESLKRFAERLAAQHGQPSASPSRTASAARKSHSKAKQSLSRAGWGKKSSSR